MRTRIAALVFIGLMTAACSATTSTTTDSPRGNGTGGGQQDQSTQDGTDFTVSQQNAIEAAQSYLDTGAFSEAGLIQQLSSKYGEGFPKADAVFAVNHIEVDWNQQAAKAAKSYLDTGSFSCSGLIEQLESSYGEGFTHAQAVYGAKQTGLCS
jgi:hypothetical protein